MEKPKRKKKKISVRIQNAERKANQALADRGIFGGASWLNGNSNGNEGETLSDAAFLPHGITVCETGFGAAS